MKMPYFLKPPRSTMSKVLTVLSLLMTFTHTLANCPSSCNCSDETLIVTCEKGKLDVLPITLNPSIQRLIIKYNKIKTVDSSIQFYGELTFLDLSHNDLVSILPKNFESQKQLKELYLHRNKLSSVPNDTFLGLKSLIILNMKGNYLEELNSDVFSAMPNLEELNLGTNRISRIDQNAFRGLNSLKVLYLEDNQLSAVPTPSFTVLSSLAELHIGINGFTSLPDRAFDGLKKLSFLDLSGAGLVNITDDAFGGLSLLRSIDLTGNQLKHVPTSQLSGLSRLEDLTLGQNDFSTIEADAFKGLVNLRKLAVIAASQLERIEKAAFNDNLNLDTLILNSNKKLDTIEEGSLSNLPNLKHLNLRENAFETLSESLVVWHELKTLDLSDNPFHCGCELAWLQEKVLQKNMTEVQCMSPDQLKDRTLRTIAPDELGCALHPTQRQWLIGASIVVSVALTTALFLMLYHCRKRMHNALKDNNWNNRAISRKEHEYQKTFSDEDFIVRAIHHPQFPVTQQNIGPGVRPIPVTEL